MQILSKVRLKLNPRIRDWTGMVGRDDYREERDKASTVTLLRWRLAEWLMPSGPEWRQGARTWGN